MSEFSELRVSGSNLNEFSRSLTKAVQSLPSGRREQLEAIRNDCVSAFGFDGMHERLNNKTVGEILEEFGNFRFPFRTVAEGEVDGMKYRLTEPISDPEEKGRKA